MAALTLPAFRPSRTFWWMVALSLTIHTLFLYGVRIKSERVDEPPRMALNATITAPAAVAPEPEPIKPVETPLPAIEPVAKKPIAKPSRKKTPAPEPITERTPAVPMPGAALDMAPSPVPALEPAPEPIVESPSSEPAPPPSIASVLERSGAKMRAPTPIENPTMPADDVVVAPPAVATEPLPAIATAPHSLEPIAQEGPPPAAPQAKTATPVPVESVPSVAAEPLLIPLRPSETPAIPNETPPPETEIVKASPSISTIPAPPPTATIDPNILPLPAAGEAQYKLRMGVVSGELILSWNFADGHYRLDSVAQGTGIFAIAGKYIQASEGDITTSGLRPAAFSVERRGRKDSAKFNWPESSVQFNGKSGERTESVNPGAQDMLSLLFQLAFTPPLGDDLTVIVTNGRKLERYAFERAGEETIELEGGTFRTLKILKQRKGDEDGMEVWLALEHHYLPVKIRVTDKKGSVIEQNLMAIKVLSAKQ